jgi:serine/threonine-protein kinase
MRSSSAESELVREIGKYHLIAELARGGMGIVHLAATHGPGGCRKLLVVKELRPELSADPSYVSMFLDEARLAARLSHPNIAQTLEVVSDGNRPYMVMEFLDGRSFHRVVRRFRGLDNLTVGGQLRVIAESLLGLHHAHELQDFDGRPLGVVHRDVSPLNVLVTFDGQAKLLDFGIAKSVQSTLQTQAGVLKGRIAYMAPEQAWGQKVDRRADVYSAGVMLWEAAAGRRVWHGMTDMETLASVLRDTPPRLRAVKPEAPEDLDAICARAMARHPEDRYESAAALFEALEKHLATRSDAMTMREIGALAARAFAEERRKVNAVIEDAMLRGRAGPRSGVMPAVTRYDRDTPSSLSDFTRRRDASSPSSQSAAVEPCVTAPPVAATSRPGRPSIGAAGASSTRRLALSAVTMVGVFMAVGALLMAGARVGIPSNPRPQAAALVSPPARGEADLVDVTIHATPPSATISIDGLSVDRSPLHARFARDSLVHRLIVSADGYDSKVVDLALSNDVSIDVGLERSAAPPSRSSAPPKN